jgi:hypothetical protein
MQDEGARRIGRGAEAAENGNVNGEAWVAGVLAHSQECLPAAGSALPLANREIAVPVLLLRWLLLELVVLWVGGILLRWHIAAWVCAGV